MQHQPYRGRADQARMLALAQASPENNLHVVDLPYRLSSWAFDDPANVAIWEDERGELLAWAVVQPPFWNVDIVCHPAAERTAYPLALSWADQRARELQNTRSARPAWFVGVLDHQRERMAMLQAAGFADQARAPQDPWSQVFLARPASDPLIAVPAPAGFAIRPLAGAAEVDAYVDLHRAVFGTPNMTREWRARTTAQPAYRADHDLVALAPDGALAAFCIGWFDAHSRCGQIEPLGVRADCRGRGLARAILSETLRRLYARGAAQVFVETDNFRDAAFALYQATGFRLQHDVWIYRKDYA
jgi:mycothiol synthase